MPKLKAELLIDLTPEQFEAAKESLKKLAIEGGMIIGSLQSGRGDDFVIRHRAGFRWVDAETARQIIEIANAQGEENNA